jgi:hypothetical protein
VIEEASTRVLDRALTIGGIGRTDSGELSPVTQGIYAGQMARAVAWKRDVLHSSVRTFTPEQVAHYALWLVEQGYARATAELAVRAIRWSHRVAGEPVPDGLPASYVLRDGDSTADDHALVNDLDVAASRDPTELLTAFASACRLSLPIGARDMLIVTLLYETGMSIEAIAALDRNDIDLNRTPVEGRMSYGVPVGPGESDVAWLTHTPDHDSAICAACSCARWLRHLSEQGVEGGPLFRSIDKGGNIGGTATAKGGRSTSDGRLRAKSIPDKILRPLAARVGMVNVMRAPARALRLAGAAQAYVTGKATLDQAARRAGYTPRSGLLLQHLLELTAPPTREDTPA